jgi:hypothetical protein
MAWIQDTYSKTLGHGGLDAIGIQQTFFMVFSEMEITKNKNLKARLDYRFSKDLNPYPSLWIFLLISQKFGKSLETFGSQILFLRF